MAAWVCDSCTAVYSVGAPCCPHCRATDYTEQGEEPMPKITVHGGASNAADPETAGAAEPPASAAPAPDDEVTTDQPLTEEDVERLREHYAGGASSPGKSSSPSSETPEQSTEQSETAAPSPARTTASRSKKAQTGASAPGTDGGPTADTSEK